MINKRNSWFEYPGIILFAFAFLILLIRIFLRGQILELDEAEQIVMAQQLSPGYPDQPPLYSWLQYGFFRLFGCNLLSLALLKSLLLFCCIYSFHQICRLHCQSVALAWCATTAWALIPAISLDLIKDNTHSVLALLSACLTWYWFVAPSRFNKALSYLILGCILGIGFLSKFNYLLFLSILLISTLTIPVYRSKLLNPYLILSLVVGLVIASPYIVWLQQHISLGFRSMYKLSPEDKQQWYGFAELIIATIFFIVPTFLVARLCFPLRVNLKQQLASNTLLFRFHFISFPFLIAVIILASMRNFETRWLIPILFLCPLLCFGQIRAKEVSTIQIRKFLIICILTQIVFFMALLYRGFYANKIRNQFSLQQIVETLRKEQQHSDFIVSDSHWLIGNLMQNFPATQGWLLHPASQPLLPEGKSLLIWQSPEPPFWVNLFAKTARLGKIKLIEDPRNHRIIAGFSYVLTYKNVSKCEGFEIK